MSLLGECDDCGAEPINLQFKPDAPLDQQDRPSICIHCKEHREAVMREGGF